MTYEEFINTYIPRKNHLDINAAFDGCMYETYGDEDTFIRSSDKKHVWTIIDVNALYVVPGRHYVNRLGYLITENPWEEDNIEIEIENYDDDNSGN